MPTLEEKLDGMLTWVQDLAEHSCHYCDGHGCEAVLQLDGSWRFEGPPCGICDATGRVRLDAETPPIAVGVYAAGMRAVIEARDGGDFDAMNRTLDWMWQYTLRRIVWEQASAPEGAMEAAVKRAAEIGMPNAVPKMVMTAERMSEEEIERLLAEDD